MIATPTAMFPWHDSHSPDLEDHMDAGDAALIHQDFQGELYHTRMDNNSYSIPNYS